MKKFLDLLFLTAALTLVVGGLTTGFISAEESRLAKLRECLRNSVKHDRGLRAVMAENSDPLVHINVLVYIDGIYEKCGASE